MIDILLAVVMAILSILFGTEDRSIVFEVCTENTRYILQTTSMDEDQAADVFWPSELVRYVPTTHGRAVIVLRSPIGCEVE